MQEVRGSTPLSSTFPQVKDQLRSSKIIFERLQPTSRKRLKALVQLEADAGQKPTGRPVIGWVTAFAVRQPNWQPIGDPSGSCPTAGDVFGAVGVSLLSVNLKDLQSRHMERQIAESGAIEPRAALAVRCAQIVQSGWLGRCAADPSGSAMPVAESKRLGLAAAHASWAVLSGGSMTLKTRLDGD
jgi:hypothetical protein